MNVPLDGLKSGFMNVASTGWSEGDKNSAFWQFIILFAKPHSLFKHMRYHRHESGIWARGHFRFALFEIMFIAIFSLIWFIFPSYKLTLNNFCACLITFVGFDFIIVGIALATIFWWGLNKWGIASRSYRESRQDVEWKFCIDAYCNGYVAVIIDFLFGYPIFHILSIAIPNYFFTYFVPNTLIVFAAAHFTFLFIESLNVLPFIKRRNFVLYMIPIVIIYVLSLAFQWPIAIGWINLHFLSVTK